MSRIDRFLRPLEAILGLLPESFTRPVGKVVTSVHRAPISRHALRIGVSFTDAASLDCPILDVSPILLDRQTVRPDGTPSPAHGRP
jgi:hypothetical protein